MERITRKKLDLVVAKLNAESGKEYRIDHAACYGGYELALTGRRIFNMRTNARQFYYLLWAYIDGMRAGRHARRTACAQHAPTWPRKP